MNASRSCQPTRIERWEEIRHQTTRKLENNLIGQPSHRTWFARPQGFVILVKPMAESIATGCTTNVLT